ncbi:MAG: hypothetical protein SOX70_04135 [Peptoniphilaceae bacterium]|nr:hypothetical protein [Peptoniphilaceae bacterium]MDY6146759.1 hypothetical protein [Peptoniphilaceae bacterium]
MRSGQGDLEMAADPDVDINLMNLKIAKVVKLHKPDASLLNVE